MTYETGMPLESYRHFKLLKCRRFFHTPLNTGGFPGCWHEKLATDLLSTKPHGNYRSGTGERARDGESVSGKLCQPLMCQVDTRGQQEMQSLDGAGTVRRSKNLDTIFSFKGMQAIFCFLPPWKPKQVICADVNFAFPGHFASSSQPPSQIISISVVYSQVKASQYRSLSLFSQHKRKNKGGKHNRRKGCSCYSSSPTPAVS